VAKERGFMARRAVREYDAKRLLARYLPDILPEFDYPAG
jgi:hypothetical protein